MSYLVSDKLYYFAQENVTQSFPNKNVKSLSPKKIKLDENTIHESVLFNEDDSQQLKDYKDLGRDYLDFLKEEYKKRNKVTTYDPIVLFNFWKTLKLAQQQKEDEKLRSTFKSIRSNSKKKISVETQKRLLGGEGSFKLDNAKVNENIQLKAILNSNPDDVSYTLKLHSKDAHTEANISNFMEDRNIELKMKQKSKKPKRKLTKECQDRLFPKTDTTSSKKSSIFNTLLSLYLSDSRQMKELEINDIILFNYWFEMPADVKSKNKLNYSSSRNVKILLEQAYHDKCVEFCEKLEVLYKIEHPDHKDYKRANIMYEFWKNLPENDTKTDDKTFQNPREIIKVLENFYFQKISVLCKMFQDRFGFEIDNCKDKNGKIIMTKEIRLFKFWKNEIVSEPHVNLNATGKSQPQQSFISNYSRKANDTRKLKKIDFECDENIIFLIDEYFKDKEYRQNIRNQEREKEETKLEQEKMDNKRKKAKTEEQKEKYYDKLAQPKDCLKLGKALLHLRKMFPKDKILLKMIFHEFKKNKVSKYPLEYDLYDSEEEELIKGHSNEEKEKEYMKEKEREHEIIEHFIKDIDSYYNEKNKSLLAEKKQMNNQRHAEIKINRYMENIAKTFVNLRKRRFEEKIPTLNAYLSEKYIELKSLHKEIVKKMFPHVNYGESKRLKKKSFPISFKRYFFQTVKSFVKKKNEFERNDKKKLPFWAPPSISKCRFHHDVDCPIDCKFQSLNKIITNLSKTTKDSKILGVSKGKEKVWELNNYYEDRLKVMTTYADAKNCTFTPAILSRMPEKYKAFMESVPQYQSWVQTKLSKPKSFEEWVKSMGENFTRRFPGLYKYGIFKRCVNWWRRGENVKAYKKLAEVFDIDKIKKYFNPNYKELQKESMFTYENLGIDARKLNIHEDFDNKKNINFLYDVYKLITYLEEYETEILKMKKEINMMLKAEPAHSDHFINEKHTFHSNLNKSENLIDKNLSYSYRREQVKSHMCPLRDQCPDDIRPRWPNNDNKSILPFGAKCPFAHHVFELKFKKELKVRRQMLKNNLKMLDKHLSAADVVQQAWIPGGRKFVDCIGCGEQLGSKGQKGGYVKKGLCASCEMRKAITRKLEGYLVKAKLKRGEMTSTKTFKQKQIMRQNEDENFNKKLGFLQRSNILYSKERYSEAFAVILKAIDLVKNELANDEVKQKNKEDEWRQKIDLNYEGHLNQETLYKEQYLSKLNTNEQSEFENENNYVQKLTLFASKTGIIGEKHLNVNEFINHQIELTYLKIEKKFLDKQKDINLLKQKIDRIEGGESTYIEEKKTEESERENKGYKKKMKVKKTMMCETFLANGTCEKLKDSKEPCLYAHNPVELDLINDEIKVNNLQKTIKFCNKKLTQTETPLSWNPTSKKDAIKNINDFDELEEIKRKARQKEKRNSSSENAKMKMSKVNSIYEKDYEDLSKYPYERNKMGAGLYS